MNDFTFDLTLGIMIVIGGFIVLLISLIVKELRHKVDHRNKKGVVIKTEYGNLNKWGIILVIGASFSMVCGVFKSCRDTKAQSDKVQLNEI
jgi:hypothetical protein